MQGADLAPLSSAAGWPSPPARQQRCGACVGGWASTGANASYCTMCGPGSYSPAAFSPACPPCPAGTYASSWGSTHCRHCVTGAIFLSTFGLVFPLGLADFVLQGSCNTCTPCCSRHDVRAVTQPCVGLVAGCMAVMVD